MKCLMYKMYMLIYFLIVQFLSSSSFSKSDDCLLNFKSQTIYSYLDDCSFVLSSPHPLQLFPLLSLFLLSSKVQLNPCLVYVAFLNDASPLEPLISLNSCSGCIQYEKLHLACHYSLSRIKSFHLYISCLSH